MCGDLRGFVVAWDRDSGVAGLVGAAIEMDHDLCARNSGCVGRLFGRRDGSFIALLLDFLEQI
jgi:hypothetical protein